MILTCCLSLTVSSQKLEMDELGPGQAVYYTWAEPTGSRVLRWSWGPYSGELKNEQVRTRNNQHPESGQKILYLNIIRYKKNFLIDA